MGSRREALKAALRGMKAKKYKKMMIIILAVIMIFATAVFIIFPPSAGKLPSCKSPNGISEKIWINIDGADIGLILLSEDINNPVLLVCGGGPGIPQYLMESFYPSPLPKKFTVCYWDYIGTGMSYSPDISADEMTTERFISDTIAVADYLRKRFDYDKIYIMGHSFGTFIALKTAQSCPEKFKCYIAMAQICDQKRSEFAAFDYMKQQYEDGGNKAMAAEFEKYDIRSSDEDYDRYKYSGLRDKAMHGLGVGTARDMKSVIAGIFLPSLRCGAYTQGERINIWRSKFTVSKKCPAAKDSNLFNAFEDVPELDIPIYFAAGKYDYTCCTSLQEEYYNAVEAPAKKIYIFDNSAHSPLYEEYEKGLEVLEEIKQETEKAEELIN